MKGLYLEKSVLFIITLIFAVSSVNALGIGQCLNVELTDISPTSIELGEEFTVGILIDNCGYKVPSYVVFELVNISPYVEIIEPLKINIPEMGYSTSERFLLYHMRLKEDAVPGTYIFKYVLEYGPGVNSTIKDKGEFSVNIIGKKANLNIASLKTKPTIPVEDEIVELTLRIENYGKGEANSVKVRLAHDFKGIKESYIGTLQPDEDSPVVFTFIPSKKGEYNIPVTITYLDDFGRKDILTEINLVIFKKETNVGLIVLILVLIGGVIGGVYYFLKKSKKKDEIIKQFFDGDRAKKIKEPSKKKR
ncbi:MAG: hypothetical protein KJ623_00690 [Nanoarchaeota archaeon]|nr:hypothetical protein [Nanoarchaeota archaeon]MBU0963029.1 hypothetical protein [Nanoarchaeota archaeon]